ncbi:MAG TPA: molybdopterin-dependent oxidoreductase [Promineifilum sp.]
MKLPWVNILLLILLVLQAITGYFGFTEGRERMAWILWLHGIGAYALLVLIWFKLVVILDTWRRRRRWTTQRYGFLLTLVLLLLVLATGLLWTFDGPIYLGGFSLVSIHIYIAIPLMALMLWHSWQMRFIRNVDGAIGRRLFLAGALSAIGGLLVWATFRRFKQITGFKGALRRFTGSYEVGSFTREFPVVSWIADRPPPIDPSGWQLEIAGHVARPIALAYDAILNLPRTTLTAVLDCTGGWFSQQRWQGPTVGELLAFCGALPKARSVTFESISGYKRRFDIQVAQGFLLALGTVDGEPGVEYGAFRPLEHGHGFPLRLVAPGYRGMEWVKWVTMLTVNDSHAFWQSPLPLQ